LRRLVWKTCQDAADPIRFNIGEHGDAHDAPNVRNTAAAKFPPVCSLHVGEVPPQVAFVPGGTFFATSDVQRHAGFSDSGVPDDEMTDATCRLGALLACALAS
jgi:hypothetical protein